MENKRCSACGIIKTTENFTVDKYKKDKLASRCKECKRKRQSELYRSESFIRSC